MAETICNLRQECIEMMDEYGITQAELVRRIKAQQVYPVTKAEMSNAINGTSQTPKAHRVLMDVHTILVQERKRQHLRKRKAASG